MPDKPEKNCPGCKQQLRFPENVGGMVMACPSCGYKFHSDFKLGNAKSPASNQGKKSIQRKPKVPKDGFRVIV